MSADPRSPASLATWNLNAARKQVGGSGVDQGANQPSLNGGGGSNNNSNSSSSIGNNNNNNRNVKKQHQSGDGGGPPKFRSTDEFIAGWTAAFINTTALFPINKLIFRQMAGGHRTQIAADQMKEEGLRYLYRGILPPLIQKMVSVSIMFGSFGHYKKWADTKFTNWPPIANLALAACLTGSTEAVLTPLERVQMLLQDQKYHKQYKNTVDALVKLRQFGSAEYYRGLTCVLVRNGPSNILFFGLRDEIKKLMPRFRDDDVIDAKNAIYSAPDSSQLARVSSQLNPQCKIQTRHKDSMLHDFLSGAILGMFISTLFYPLSVVRTRMQTRAPGSEFLSIVKAFNAVYIERDRKFTRLFHGCLINVLRQFVSWGIINCSYEFVLNSLHEFK